MNRLKSFLACGALIVAGALMPTLAVTQALIIEEVVVTAQKRAESAQDIPVSVTAIDANTIESLGLEATADVVRPPLRLP